MGNIPDWIVALAGMAGILILYFVVWVMTMGDD